MKPISRIACVVAVAIALAGCSKSKVICGKEFKPYGLLNTDDYKNAHVHYKPVIGNAILGIVFIETIIAPIYFFGFDVLEPNGLNGNVTGTTIDAPSSEQCKEAHLA